MGIHSAKPGDKLSHTLGYTRPQVGIHLAMPGDTPVDTLGTSAAPGDTQWPHLGIH
jgi:hypothetical protein